MVIEVKKNLYSKELSDGYENLKSVADLQDHTRVLNFDLIRDAFTAISRKPLPHDIGEINVQLDEKDQMLYHSLVLEALLPLRVIFGYEGFKSEITLREKFIEYIEHNSHNSTGKIKGFGATSFPNLIVSGENALIKTNGMPYGVTFDQINEYCWIASYRRNPLILFLELLWTRLTYFYDIPVSIFGDELQQEALIPLLTATGSKNGWSYTVVPYSNADIDSLADDSFWSPTILSETEYILLNFLCFKESIEINQAKQFINSEENFDTILSHLSNERLIYIKDQKIKLLTKKCVCVIDPDLGFIAADDYDGRLSNWLKSKMN